MLGSPQLMAAEANVEDHSTEGFVVPSVDVVKLVMQYLHEQGMVSSARELQNESGVTLNTVDDRERFAADIRHGKWDLVLPVVSRMSLPTATMVMLFEQVVAELLELREVELAREMLRTAEPLLVLRSDDPQRYVALDTLAQKGAAFDAAATYGGGGGSSSSSSSSILRCLLFSNLLD